MVLVPREKGDHTEHSWRGSDGLVEPLVAGVEIGVAGGVEVSVFKAQRGPLPLAVGSDDAVGPAVAEGLDASLGLAAFAACSRVPVMRASGLAGGCVARRLVID
jgi:hypothetical protein